MSMYSFLKYSSNYSDMTDSLLFCSKDEVTNFNNDIGNNDNFNSFEYNYKLLGNHLKYH